MKLVVGKTWILGGATAFALGVLAAACATSSSASSADAGVALGGGTNCAILTQCCATLNPAQAAMCTPVLSGNVDGTCASFLGTIQKAGLCLSSGSGSGTGVTIITSGTGSALGSSTGTGVGMDAGMDSTASSGSGSGPGDAGSGSGATTDAGSGTGSGTGTGTGSGTGTGTGSGTGGGGGIPTTCAQANSAIGCCGSDGKSYYCAAGSTTVTSKACASGTTCGWNTAKMYYSCVASPGTPPASDPMACQ